MSRKILIAIAIGAAGLATACITLPYQTDLDAVSVRYEFRYNEECQSWLYSATTGFRYCASPQVILPVEGGDAGGFETLEDGPTDLAALSERGEEVYGLLCATCHQADGQGMGSQFPPLAGSGDYYGDAQNHAGIIIHGLNGNIVVQGKEYNGIMPPQGEMLSDYDVAAVATYERHAWGNNDGVVLPSDAQAARNK
jgi:mono/diheme cytochrome c family protein